MFCQIIDNLCYMSHNQSVMILQASCFDLNFAFDINSASHCCSSFFIKVSNKVYIYRLNCVTTDNDPRVQLAYNNTLQCVGCQEREQCAGADM